MSAKNLTDARQIIDDVIAQPNDEFTVRTDLAEAVRLLQAFVAVSEDNLPYDSREPEGHPSREAYDVMEGARSFLSRVKGSR